MNDLYVPAYIVGVLTLINSFLLVANLLVTNSTMKMYTEFFKELAQQGRKK